MTTVKSKGFGGIYDKYGSHHIDIERRKNQATGFRLNHHPGTSGECSICRKRKPTKGGSKSTGRFVCAECRTPVTKEQK